MIAGSHTKFTSLALVLLSVELQFAQAQRNRSPDDIGYFRGSNWQVKSGVEKLSELWTKCVEDSTI